MSQINHYREILTHLVSEYGQHKPRNAEVEVEIIVDLVRDHYEVLHLGWQGERRIHGSVIHLDIINGKIWIQYDGTNRPVAEALLEAGVPREDIVLGFHPASLRKYTDFAAA